MINLDPKSIYLLAPDLWDWVIFTLIFSLVFKLGFARMKKESYSSDAKSVSVINALAFILGLTVATMLVFVQGFSLQRFVSSGFLIVGLSVFFGFLAYFASRKKSEYGGEKENSSALYKGIGVAVGVFAILSYGGYSSGGFTSSNFSSSLSVIVFWLIAIGIIIFAFRAFSTSAASISAGASIERTLSAGQGAEQVISGAVDFGKKAAGLVKNVYNRIKGGKSQNQQNGVSVVVKLLNELSDLNEQYTKTPNPALREKITVKISEIKSLITPIIVQFKEHFNISESLINPLKQVLEKGNVCYNKFNVFEKMVANYQQSVNNIQDADLSDENKSLLKQIKSDLISLVGHLSEINNQKDILKSDFDVFNKLIKEIDDKCGVLKKILSDFDDFLRDLTPDFNKNKIERFSVLSSRYDFVRESIADSLFVNMSIIDNFPLSLSALESSIIKFEESLKSISERVNVIESAKKASQPQPISQPLQNTSFVRLIELSENVKTMISMASAENWDTQKNQILSAVYLVVEFIGKNNVSFSEPIKTIALASYKKGGIWATLGSIGNRNYSYQIFESSRIQHLKLIDEFINQLSQVK